MRRRPDDLGFEHARWCDACETYHGQLYACPSYPPELLAQIKAADARFCEAVRSGSAFPPGTPTIVAGIFRLFAGAA